MERRPITDGERIAARIERRGDCWIWSGRSTARGYPVLTSANGNVSIIPLLWSTEHGPVPDGMVLTCSHPRAGLDVCVNPMHYQPRPRGRALAEVCKWGHDLTDPDNVWENGDRRYCLPCVIRRTREWRRRNPGYADTYRRRTA
jgi:hypothetical protein